MPSAGAQNSHGLRVNPLRIRRIGAAAPEAVGGRTDYGNIRLWQSCISELRIGEIKVKRGARSLPTPRRGVEWNAFVFAKTSNGSAYRAIDANN